jgi:hypothetical protein
MGMYVKGLEMARLVRSPAIEEFLVSIQTAMIPMVWNGITGRVPIKAPIKLPQAIDFGSPLIRRNLR